MKKKIEKEFLGNILNNFNDLLFKDVRLESMVMDVEIALDVKRVTSSAVYAVSEIK